MSRLSIRSLLHRKPADNAEAVVEHRTPSRSLTRQSASRFDTAPAGSEMPTSLPPRPTPATSIPTVGADAPETISYPRAANAAEPSTWCCCCPAPAPVVDPLRARRRLAETGSKPPATGAASATTGEPSATEAAGATKPPRAAQPAGVTAPVA